MPGNEDEAARLLEGYLAASTAAVEPPGRLPTGSVGQSWASHTRTPADAGGNPIRRESGALQGERLDRARGDERI